MVAWDVCFNREFGFGVIMVGKRLKTVFFFLH